MEKTFPLGVCCDRTKKAEPRPEREPAPALEKIPRMLGVTPGEQASFGLNFKKFVDPGAVLGGTNEALTDLTKRDIVKVRAL